MTTLYLITFTYNFTSYPDEREDERILFKGSLKDAQILAFNKWLKCLKEIIQHQRNEYIVPSPCPCHDEPYWEDIWMQNLDSMGDGDIQCGWTIEEYILQNTGIGIISPNKSIGPK